MNEASEMVIPEQANPPGLKPIEDTPAENASMLTTAFKKQRETYLADPVPDYEEDEMDLLNTYMSFDHT